MYATGLGGERVEATPGARASCPDCGGQLVAHAGRIVRPHWAHCQRDCDPWTEPESEWHLWWKSCAPERAEVRVGRHRTDLLGPLGAVEFQHSPLPEADVLAREEHYLRECGGLVWVLDTEPFAGSLEVRDRGDLLTARWRWPRRSWRAARCPVYLDLRDGYLLRADHRSADLSRLRGPAVLRADFARDVCGGSLREVPARFLRRDLAAVLGPPGSPPAWEPAAPSGSEVAACSPGWLDAALAAARQRGAWIGWSPAEGRRPPGRLVAQLAWEGSASGPVGAVP